MTPAFHTASLVSPIYYALYSGKNPAAREPSGTFTESTQRLMPWADAIKIPVRKLNNIRTLEFGLCVKAKAKLKEGLEAPRTTTSEIKTQHEIFSRVSTEFRFKLNSQRQTHEQRLACGVFNAKSER